MAVIEIRPFAGAGRVGKCTGAVAPTAFSRIRSLAAGCSRLSEKALHNARALDENLPFRGLNQPVCLSGIGETLVSNRRRLSRGVTTGPRIAAREK